MTVNALVRAATAAMFTLLPHAGLAQTTIADVAPEESFFVMSVPDWGDMAAAWARTPLGDLWERPEVQEFVERLSEEPVRQLREMLGEIDTELEELQPPAGTAGMALYFVPGESTPRMIALADYGERADDMRAVIDRLIDRGVEDDLIILDEEEHRGATILTITRLADEEEEQDEEESEEDWEEWDEEDWEETDPISDFFAGLDELTLAIREGVFVASQDAGAVDRALEALEGEPVGAIGRAEEYLAARRQHPEDLSGFMVMRISPLLDLLAESVGESAGMFLPEGFEPMPMLDALGLSSLEAISLGVRFGVADGMVEQTMGVLAPDPTGLVAIAAAKSAPLDPPAFIGADAAEYSQMTFDFSGLIPAAREVLAALPEEARAEVEVRFEQGIVPILTPLLDSLGPQVYSSTTYRRPFDADSARAFTAIPTRDETIVNNLLATVPVLEASQVQGNVIYELQLEAMGMGAMDAAIGVGAGHVFIGAREDVEDALRQAGNPDGPRLATEERFRRAVAPLRDPGLWYGYTDFSAAYAWMLWQMENMEQVTRKQFEDMGMSEEEIDEMMEYAGAAAPEWADALPPLDVVRDYVGDVSFEMHATPDGMRGRWLVLPPARE